MSAEAPAAFLERAAAPRLAYRAVAGVAPGVVFLPGFLSDMRGQKAVAVEALCRRLGHAFVRFDYRGHGESGGRAEEGSIGRWAEDVVEVLDRLTTGPQVLVGSSMGGWLMLLAARARPDRVAALVGIAAAPDFVKTMWAELPEAARRAVETDGVYYRPSPYGPDGYPITRELIEDGRRQCLLDAPVPFAGPVRLLHGMRDDDVPWRTSLELAAALATDDVVVELVKDGDHRLSREPDVARLERTVAELLARLSAGG